MDVRVNFDAHYNKKQRKFYTRLWFDGKQYIETMSKARWKRFIDNINNQSVISIGGIKILLNTTEQKADAVREGMKKYFNAVNYAYEQTGSTDYLQPYM